MELFNDTPFTAAQLRLEQSDTDINGVLLVKSSFEQDKGRWVPAAQQLPLVGVQLETDFGVFHSEYFTVKEGVDVCVLGTVRLGGAARLAELAIDVGRERRELLVFGDRRWQRRGLVLRPSDPDSFEEMPVSYTRAYGGSTEHDYETTAYADNPLGRGYYLSATTAEHGLLPNIEQTEAARIASWEEAAPVAGWAPYPRTWGIRAREGIQLRDDPLRNPIPRAPLPRLYNNAHSTMIFQSLPEETVIAIRGMRAAELRFELPALKLHAEIDTGGRKAHAQGYLDGVHVWVDANRITLTHRLYYRYEYRKGERRSVRLMREMIKGGV